MIKASLDLDGGLKELSVFSQKDYGKAGPYFSGASACLTLIWGDMHKPEIFRRGHG